MAEQPLERTDSKDSGGGSPVAESNIPTRFNQPRQYVGGRKTSDQTILNDPTRLEPVTLLNSRLNHIDEAWRDSNHETAIERAVQALDKLHELQDNLTPSDYEYFRYCIYRNLGASLRSITSVGYKRLSGKIKFCFSDNCLDAWWASKMSDYCLKIYFDSSGAMPTSDEATSTVQAADDYKREMCQSHTNACLALLRYASQMEQPTVKDGFVKEAIKECLLSLGYRSQVERDNSTWDRYIINRIYMITCLVEDEKLQDEVMNFTKTEDGSLQRLEKILKEVQTRFNDVAVPDQLVNLDYNQYPTMVSVNEESAQASELWWLSGKDHPPQDLSLLNPNSDGLQHPLSVSNPESTGSLGLFTDGAPFVRVYISELNGVYGQIAHADFWSHFQSSMTQENRRGDGFQCNLDVGRVYHARYFQYHARDDTWRYNNCCIKLNGPLDVEVPGQFRDLFSVDLFHYGSRVMKRYRSKGRHCLTTYLTDVRVQSIARFYAFKFNERVSQKFGCFSYLRADHVQVFSDSSRRNVIDFFNVEEDGRKFKFKKLTNNWRSAANLGEHALGIAFSHYTYMESGMKMMVVDLQGFEYLDDNEKKRHLVLTDPGIHCRKDIANRFGYLNHSGEGIKAFFSHQHPVCNEICRHLGLASDRPPTSCT